MSVCVFFGHRECCDLDAGVLREAVEALIHDGVDTFLVGHQGQFDAMVYGCLKSLSRQYPYIRYNVVLAYLPTNKDSFADFRDTVYPEGIEAVHPKYAITWRNRYMLCRADICLCYINYTWGGAYQFVRAAQSRGLRIINIGSANIP